VRRADFPAFDRLNRSRQIPSGMVAAPGRAVTSELTLVEVLFWLTVLAAFILRVWDVGTRAMHLDESTVAWFGWQLLTGHGYAYDPVYHGPFQHEALALIFLIFGGSETTARLLAVTLGTVLVALPWMIRDYLGRLGALLTSLFLCVSPSFLYFARFERDDTYMECFTFLLVVLVLRFLRDRRPWQLYAAGLTLALAFATKESIYIVAFIFSSYLVFLGLGRLGTKSALVRRSIDASGRLASPWLLAALLLLVAGLCITAATGFPFPAPVMVLLVAGAGVVGASASGSPPLSGSVRQVLGRHWLNAATAAVALIVLMYSTFGSNLNGLWDQAHPLFASSGQCPYPLALHLNACRKDLLGGLLYWLSQHRVARGGQPWFYYLLLYGLYEQIAVIGGAIAIIHTFVARSLSLQERALRMFFVYWAVVGLGVYSWAGEKFPWLGIHPLLPLTILAGIEIASLVRRPDLTRQVALAGLTVLLILTVHNTLVLNYVDGANPVEMMVYVQSSPDTATDATRIQRLSNRATGGNTLAVTVDSTDTWPFAWYLRDMPNVAYPAPGQTLRPPYVSNPIILLDQSDAQTQSIPTAVRTHYTRRLRRLDWWFPEDYKVWTWSSFAQRALDPRSWEAIWSWETVRKPFGPRNGSWYYLYVRRGYFAAL